MMLFHRQRNPSSPHKQRTTKDKPTEREHGWGGSEVRLRAERKTTEEEEEFQRSESVSDQTGSGCAENE